ncbi:MAG TPA: bifunctional phosphoserine phosphatase/homoserine phosphotransferase ThrH [Verrucomicrobiae bacterium]|nr:bifunctional phosphoserine phosphatase/homoserine phosphotransferase ThrH [Verrucomicrobiae bacterium]
MKICCLDLEGVLVPEIWIRVAEKTRIKELRITTRDWPDYDKLMKYRIGILKERGIRLKDIQKVIAGIGPLPGAKKFLDALRAQREVIILSDTFYEFAAPLMRQLDMPTLFCNYLSVDKKGFIKDYHLRIRNGKEKAVKALRKLNFYIKAAGDSYNDLTMLRAANQGILFNPPESIRKECPQFRVATKHAELLKLLLA